MLEWLFAWLESLPGPLAVIALAANPAGEVRLAVPAAMLLYKMSWAEAFVWSLLGNLLIAPIAWRAYPVLERWMRRSPRLAAWLDGLRKRMQNRTSTKVKRLQEFAIAALIAVPLPGSGAWTGLLVAHVWGMQPRRVWGPFYAGCTAATALATALVATGAWAFPIIYGP